MVAGLWIPVYPNHEWKGSWEHACNKAISSILHQTQSTIGFIITAAVLMAMVVIASMSMLSLTQTIQTAKIVNYTTMLVTYAPGT